MIVNYLNALAGAGKTHWIMTKAIELAEEGRNVLIAVPTKQLAEEEYRRGLKSCRAVVTIIHSDTVDGSAVQTINNNLLGPQPDGQILVITHSALERITNFRRDLWDLFVDEIPQVHFLFEANLPRTHKELTEHLTLGEHYHSYRQLEIANRAPLEGLASEGQDDDGYSVPFKDIARRLLSPHWNNYVEPIAYEGLIRGKSGRKKLCINSVLGLSLLAGFHSVYVCGAHFKNSLFYHTWRTMDVEFVEVDNTGLRFNQHNGENLTIYYLTTTRWSKTTAMKFISEDKKNTILQKLVAFTTDHIGTKEFIYSQNGDDPLFPALPYDWMIPHSPHGLNSYTNFDNVMVFAARNPKPFTVNFLKDTLHITFDVISQAIHKEVAYQNVMRCSLRDPNNTNPKAIYVPDLETAEWLQADFPGATLQFLDPGIPELEKKQQKKTAKTDAERAKKSREKKRLLEALSLLKNPHVLNQNLHNIAKDSSINEENVTKFRGEIFKKLNSRFSSFIYSTETIEEFEEVLWIHFENKIFKKKEDNFLICPSHFDHTKGETTKGLDNVVFTNGIFLDFDGGDFGPEEFGQVFNDLRATTYTSFSSTKTEPKFRAWIPTSRPMDKEEYKFVIFALEDRLTNSGFVKAEYAMEGQRTHKLDSSKRHAASMFFLPCRSAEPPEDHLRHFKVWKGEDRNILDPNVLLNEFLKSLQEIDALDIQEEEQGAIRKSAAYKKKGIEMALSDWDSVCNEKGEGNNGFYKLGFRLARAGCPEWESNHPPAKPGAFVL